MATAKSTTETESGSSKTSDSKGRTSSGLTLTDLPLTKEQLLSRGEEAARLLNSPVYNLAHQSLIQSYQDRILETAPNERNLREWLYTLMTSLSDVANELASFVNQAQGLNLEELAAEESAQRLSDENRGF